MKKRGYKTLISMVLAAVITLPGNLTANAFYAETAQTGNEDAAEGLCDETSYRNEESMTSVGSNWQKIKKPRTDADGVSTWDCIWFGEYWQEDTNGDGHCFEKKTTVTKHARDEEHYDDYYTDQYGKELYHFNGEEKTYPADEKQPIKWRVLDIDEKGNALLLADKLIDIVQYYEYDETITSSYSVTWQTSTIRSYLNCYGGSENKGKKNYSGSSENVGFLNKAFTQDERNSIISLNFSTFVTRL